MNDKLKCDICIIGVGSGGFGAAAQAVKLAKNNSEDISIIVIEKSPYLGGTSTNCGVNCWEPGIGGPGVHNEIFHQLSLRHESTGIGKTTKFYASDKPWGLSEIDNTLDYQSSLKRSGVKADGMRRVHFEPLAMSNIMENMLLTYNNIKIMYCTLFIDVKISYSRIDSITVLSMEENRYFDINSTVYIDCTGDIVLSRAAGCSTAFGEDGVNKFFEISAPEKESNVVNGVSLIFRVTPTNVKTIDKMPEWVKEYSCDGWIDKTPKPADCINEYPNGDLNHNLLPVMEGNEYFNLSEMDRMKRCKARIYQYWNWLQTEKGFDNYTFKCFMPEIGVRESYRLMGRYILTENDVRAGFLKQNKKDEIIAFGDHALDTHGRRNINITLPSELDMPYGIPYSSLLPNNMDNLAVACRGASFSHIAASSCRLSRTMIAIGEAAGAAAFIAINENKSFSDVNVEKLRDLLRIPQFEDRIIKEI